MEEEVWKDIPEYEGLYMVSNYAKIKRFNRDKRRKPFKILNPPKDKNGYSYVNLSKNCKIKSFRVYKLVMETFVGPCPKGMEICHNDGDPGNSFFGNLRYDTHKNNMIDSMNHGTRAKGHKHGMAILNEKQVRIIKWLLTDGYLKQREIAKIFNVSRHTITKINNKKNWRWL